MSLGTVMTTGIFSCQQSLFLQLFLPRSTCNLLSDLGFGWPGRVEVLPFLYGLRTEDEAPFVVMALSCPPCPSPGMVCPYQQWWGWREGGVDVVEVLTILASLPHAGEPCFVIRAVRLISLHSSSPRVCPRQACECGQSWGWGSPVQLASPPAGLVTV